MSNPRQNNRNSVPQSRGEQMRVSARGRKKRRRLKDGFVLFLLFVALICVGLVLSLTVLFNAESINCENSGVRYSDSQIIAAAGLEKGDNMFRLNTAFIEAKIEKALPYVGKAEIKRRLPDTIVVCVEYMGAVFMYCDLCIYIFVIITITRNVRFFIDNCYMVIRIS